MLNNNFTNIYFLSLLFASIGVAHENNNDITEIIKNSSENEKLEIKAMADQLNKKQSASKDLDSLEYNK